jgi:hypothetical protein
VLATIVGVTWVLFGLLVLLANDGSLFEWLTTGVVLAAGGVLIIVSFWTARLSVEDGHLIARNFYGSRSVPLASVTQAEPVILGLLFWTDDGTRMRSLASGQAFDELWKTRAEKICEQVLRLARDARRAGGV